MLVETLEHGRQVMRRLQGRGWFAIDTETVALPCFYQKMDALVYGRGIIKVFSICNHGEAYSFPTSLVDPKYPLMQDWVNEVLRPLAEDPSFAWVMHNANYDVNVFFNAGLQNIVKIWDTMIGCWMADASKEKGLKARAPRYGRRLQKTANIDFDDLDELALYAEEDVIQTGEIYEMQMKGYVERHKTLWHLKADGGLARSKNPMPTGRIEVDLESLDKFMTDWIYLQELPCLRATMRAERFGFPFDVKMIKRIRGRLEADRDAVLKQIYQTAGDEINLNSSKQLVDMFHRIGVATPYKTKGGAPSVSAESLAKMSAFHPVIPQILNYRKLEKLQTVYVGKDSIAGEATGLEYYVARDGKIHCTMNTVGAVTGRFSAQLPNLTQVPSAADIYGIKKCFQAPKGFSLICLDYAQLEIRVMALLSKDPTMTRVLTDPNGDIHKETSDRFGVERISAKRINFLLQYAGTGWLLAQNLSLLGIPTSSEEGQVYWETYNNDVYAGVHDYRKQLVKDFHDQGYVRLLTGRKRSLPPLMDWTAKRELHKAETTLSNNVVQGSGQDLLKASIIRSDPRCINPDKEILRRRKLPKKHKAIISDYAREIEVHRKLFRKVELTWALQVHDEVVYFVRTEAAEEVANLLADIMCWRHYFTPITDYSVPLVVDGGVGKSWSQAKGSDKKAEPDFKIERGFENWK